MGKEEFWEQRWKALVWVGLLGFVLSCNYTNHGPLVPTLVKVLSITMTAAGFFTTAVFLTHGIMQMPGGGLSDKFGAKKVASVGLVIIAVGNILTGMATSYEQILAYKFITGLGTGSCIVAGLRYVPTFFAGKEIAFAQGVYGGTIVLGSGFVIFIIPHLLSVVGWHGVFYTTGIMAAVLAVLWHLFAPNTPTNGVVNKIDWPSLLGNRNSWLLALTQVGSFGTSIACGVWVNTMLQKNLSLDPKTAGMIGSFVLLIGIVGRPIGGLIVDKKWLTKKQVLIFAHAGLTVGFVWIGMADTMVSAALAIIFSGFMTALPFGPIFSMAMDTFPKFPGVAAGFVNTFGAFSVMILPPVMGSLVDSSGSFLSAFYLLAGVAAAASIGALGLKSLPNK